MLGRPTDLSCKSRRISTGINVSWWPHQMETFSALLTLCDGNPLVTGGFPPQRQVTRRFDVFFGMRLNKRLNKQSRRRWFQTPSHSLWRHCNVHFISSRISLHISPSYYVSSITWQCIDINNYCYKGRSVFIIPADKVGGSALVSVRTSVHTPISPSGEVAEHSRTHGRNGSKCGMLVYPDHH